MFGSVMWTEEEEEECMRMSTNHCSCASARILDVNQSYRDIQDNLNMQHTQSISHCLSVCHFYYSPELFLLTLCLKCLRYGQSRSVNRGRQKAVKKQGEK